MINNFYDIKIKDEILSCSVISEKNSNQSPQFIFLHGAGNAVKERVGSIASPIIKTGHSIVSFDFSGHGKSSGTIKNSSLKKRVDEAIGVINYFTKDKPLTVCGSSMGGYIAAKLLDVFEVETLILFCPALYDRKAYDVQFDNGFTDIIRSFESWRNTDVLTLLEKFTGNLLVVMGEDDEVIPAGVIELIMQHTQNARKKELYIIPGCPHGINTWILENERERVRLYSKIFEYL